MKSVVEYKSWTQEEIQQLSYLAQQYNNGKIQWTQIQSQLKHRSIQQCKSYYHNYIKKNCDCHDALTNKNIQYVAISTLEFLLIGNLNEVKDLEKAEYFNNIEAEIMLNIYQIQSKNSNFRYDHKFLELVKRILLHYENIKQIIDEKIQYHGEAQVGKYKINKQQWKSLTNFMNSINYTNLIDEISGILSKETQD
ncbi:Myb-like_DNA-binding domain-containing protein [Hexamita inflata]|uniref:Myb-like DNA-binding domain-containing protein n=1 Tax=Hexamita inflata TaxID=28002 RepID=A0AA86VMX5_9EUKA|nr:Myb-like DNA-binding domain-containing protein [Hexamita inflata]